MIPDKIYIGNHNENVQTGYFSRNKDYVFTQEYIRKDALLEWAKKEGLPLYVKLVKYCEEI